MTSQTQDPINQVSNMLLESMKRIQTVDAEELKIEIERAKTLSAAANQFTQLAKTKLSIEMYQNRNVPRGTIPIDSIEKPKQLLESTQKKSDE